MKAEWREYVLSIGGTQAALDRADRCLEAHERIVGEAAEDIFVSDGIDENGSRTVNHILLSTPSFFVEHKNFMTSDDFDVMERKVPTYVQYRRTDFDGMNVVDASRFSLIATYSERFYFDVYATRNNCSVLLEFSRRQFTVVAGR